MTPLTPGTPAPETGWYAILLGDGRVRRELRLVKRGEPLPPMESKVQRWVLYNTVPVVKQNWDKMPDDQEHEQLKAFNKEAMRKPKKEGTCKRLTRKPG